MVVAHVCDSCRGVDLAALGLPSLAPAEPMLGGYRCSCPCRGWGQPGADVSDNGGSAEASRFDGGEG